MKSIRATIFAVFFFFLNSFLSFAQYSYKEFSESANPIVKSEIALSLHNEFVRSDIDSIRLLALSLAIENDSQDPFVMATSERLIGSYLMRKGDCTKALDKLKHAADYFESKEDFALASQIYNEIGHALQLCVELDESLSAYNKSISLGRLSDDRTDVFNGLLGLGKSLVMLGDTSKGVNYIIEYKRRSGELQKYEAVADAYGYLGMIAEAQRNPSLANEYYDKSIKAGLSSKSMIHRSHAITNRAIRNFNLGNLDDARNDFIEALSIREALHNPKTIVESYHNLAEFYFLTDRINLSKEYYQYAIEFSEINGFLAEELEAIEALLNNKIGVEDHPELEKRRSELKQQVEEKDGLDSHIMELLFGKNEKLTHKQVGGRSNYAWYIFSTTTLMLTMLVMNKRS